ncbi:MAG: RNA chaperone Hfq [Firmicutes bacterium]|nr:RNA chaperone Hfq [Bacillota bacterium]
MAKTAMILQDVYLNQIRRGHIPVIIYLVNGVQLRGLVRAFDNFTLLLESESDGKSDLIYKHAISTITPQKPFNLALAQTTES